ncbi:MAG: phosphoribosylaminoimidazolesuccinocarboxamide synthase [Vulcanimicrobiota bacterium]
MATFKYFDWENLAALGQVYRGKVRDCLWGSDWGAIVTSDRISAFDEVFPQTIERKGEVLQSLAVHFLQMASQILPTHLKEVLDPNAMLVRRAQALPVELVIRGYLTGSAWRDYQAGLLHEKYGLALPPGMNQHARLERPVITPTTKEAAGHDQPISAQQAAEIVGGARRWAEIEDIVQQLYAQGVEWAAGRGLLLVDCKYELGLIGDRLVLIDELHTPDSSRYWLSQPGEPVQLSKEFFREWLLSVGARGVVDIPAPVAEEISRRYLELHQRLLGRELPAPEPGDAQTRILERLKGALCALSS